MKKIKELFILTLCFTAFFACKQDEAPINSRYDNLNGQALVSFKGSSSDLAVVINDTGSVDVTIEVSTVSTTDRTVGISIDPESTANAMNYSLSSSTVTIPANAYSGNVTISGVDISVETTAETILLNLDTFSETNSTFGVMQHTVNIFQVCPVPAAFFTGDYLIEQTSAQIDGYSLSHGSVVNVSVDPNSNTTRLFDTEAYISFCSGTFFTFRVNLVCNELVVPLQDTTCRCVSVTDWWGPATTNENYDTSDDSVILLTFTDDLQSDCGTPAQTTYRFTKQ